ncbi:IMPACT family protein [Herminiimonas aquatilis]|uniref:IMPACT family protein n=1 Tax=Herminiimonas aquatilis TaxID=345342 RepID=A0ABW2J570_9BURK
MYQLAAAANAEIEIKKSRFIGLLYPLTTRAEARATLLALRAQHPNAVHFCWVLICEGDSGLDDDGEPSGTAARPMYNVLVHKDVFNVLAVVVRYWGGTKLGAGGLARAYGQAISEAIKNAELMPVEAMCERRFVLQFADESTLRRLCEQYDVSVLDAQYGDAVTLRLKMKCSQADAFTLQAFDLLRGALQDRSDQALN